MTDFDICNLSDAELRDLYRLVAKEMRIRREGEAKDPKRFKAMQHNNTSGHRGVTYNKNAKRWHAKISTGSGVKHLGYFKELEDAVRARKAAEAEFWGGEV